MYVHYSFKNNQDHLERTNDDYMTTDDCVVELYMYVINIFETLYKSMGYTYVHIQTTFLD